MRTIGGAELRPCCPYCPLKFPNWSEAKRHVKYCDKGPNARGRRAREREQRNELLQCLYCLDDATRWRDFTELAAHVIRDHNPQGYSDQSKEMLEAMKLAPNLLTQQTQLTPNMLANLDGDVVIVGVREAGSAYQYSDYCLDVKIGRSTFEIPIKAINEDFREVAKKLGLDTDKWAGKKLKLSTDEYTSNRTGKTSDIIRFELDGK